MHNRRSNFTFSSYIRPLIVATCLSVWTGLSHADGYKIAQDNGCFKCHDMTAEKKAPSFQFIANAYRGRSDAEGRIQNPIRNGIKYYFLWEKMPAYRHLSDADLDELTQWIRRQ